MGGELEVPQGAAEAVMHWVGLDHDRARAALEAEQAKGEQARKGLTGDLEKLLAGDGGTSAAAEDGGASQVQARFDEAEEKGHFGYAPDPTPNENYTATQSDAPTPETDPDLAREAREAVRG